MKLSNLIAKLEAIRREHGEDILVCVTNESSGVISDVEGGPNLEISSGREWSGSIADEPAGTKYINFYAR